MAQRMSLFEDLKRRNVPRVAVGYAAIAWVLIQVGEATFDALGLPDGSQRLLILLVASGFPVVLVLAWIFDLTPDGLVRTPKDASVEVARLRVGRRVDFAIIATLLLALGLTWWGGGRGSSPELAVDPEVDQVSIVVLPFENMSADPEQDYFADGLTEDLTTDLSTLPIAAGVLVISRSTAFTYKGRDVSVAEVGRELGVRYVLEGSVRRAGDRVRITAQLIDAANDFHIWSQRYDRLLSDIFAVQEEVVEEIVDALQLELSAETFERLRKRPTQDLTAYDAHLRGMSHFVRFTRADMEEAARLFERAIELDPDFAAAYAYRGQAEMMHRVQGWDLDPERIERAAHYATRALALDPRQPGAHVLNALVAVFSGSPEAPAIIENAIAFAPRNPGALILLSHLRAQQGRTAEAQELLQRVLRIEPESTGILQLAGVRAARSGRPEEAIALLKRALATGPDNLQALIALADTYEATGHHEEARQMVQQILRVNPDCDAAAVATLLGGLGPFSDTPTTTRTLENLRRAGLP